MCLDLCHLSKLGYGCSSILFSIRSAAEILFVCVEYKAQGKSTKERAQEVTLAPPITKLPMLLK